MIYDCEHGSESELRRRTHESEKLRDFYAALLAIASHDLRQPLQVIMAVHELLAGRIGGDATRAQLERGARASTQLAEQLDLLAEALRLQECAGGPRRELVALRPFLEKLEEEHREAARRKRLGLRVLHARGTVWSDPVLLAAILRNLVRNALEYTPAGGRILVCCRRRGDALRLEVRDTGIGIPWEKLTMVFDAFERLDTKRPDGIGLGLFIVKRAADALGHSVAVSSAVGRGSCFAVSLDAVREDEAKARSSVAAAAQGTTIMLPMHRSPDDHGGRGHDRAPPRTCLLQVAPV